MYGSVSSVAPSTSGSRDDAIGPVLGDERARLVQSALVGDERVAARELAVVVVRGSVRPSPPPSGRPRARGTRPEHGERHRRTRPRPTAHHALPSRSEDRRARQARADVAPCDGVAIRGDRRLGRGLPREPLAAVSRAASPRRRRSSASASSVSTAARSAAGSRGGTSRPVTPSSHRVEQTADGARDNRTAVRHRLARDDAVALAVATGRRRRPRARSTHRAAPAGRSRPRRGRAREAARRRRRRAACPRSPRGSRGCPSPPTGGRRRGRAAAPPARRPSAGIETPLGTTRTSRAPSSRAAAASASRRAEHDARAPDEPPRGPARARARARRPSPRAAGRTASRVLSAGSAEGSQCACTRSASRAARRAAREYDARNSGSSSAFHGLRFRFPTMPCPYASPKCRNDAGETTSTSMPGFPQMLDRVAHEHPGDVVRPARVRRREDDDLHSRRARGDHGERGRERREDVEVVEGHREVEDVRDEGRDERRGHPPRDGPHASGERVAGRGRARARSAAQRRAGGRARRRTRRTASRRRFPSRRSSRRRTSAARSRAGPVTNS